MIKVKNRKIKLSNFSIMCISVALVLFVAIVFNVTYAYFSASRHVAGEVD